eukprot:gene1146-3710_t
MDEVLATFRRMVDDASSAFNASLKSTTTCAIESASIGQSYLQSAYGATASYASEGQVYLDQGVQEYKKTEEQVFTQAKGTANIYSYCTILA